MHTNPILKLHFLTVLSAVALVSAWYAADPPITDVAFSPDGKSVVACSQVGLKIFTWPELKLQKTIKASAANLHCLAFSPAGTQLAVGGGNPSEEGIVEVFSWPEGTSLMKLTGHDDSVMSLDWQDETKLLSASLDREVKQWDVAIKKSIHTFGGHSRGVTSIVVLDGGAKVSAGHDQSVRVWDAELGELIRSLNQHSQPVNALALRPTEGVLPMVASAAGDRTLRFWQPTIGRMVRYIRLDSEPLDISWIDKTYIAASCVDGHVRIVHADEVKVVGDLQAIDGWAYAIATHPTDGTIAVGGQNGQLNRIDLPK